MRSGHSLTSFAVHSILALAVMLVLPPGQRAYGPEPAIEEEHLTAGASEGSDESAGLMTPEQRRSYARVFAQTWLPILLLLIIFVVLLMVVTRHLKLWVLGRQRPVKFKPVDDVWWQSPPRRSPDTRNDGEKKDG